MGISPLKKSCCTGYSNTPAPAPNPRPDRWTLLQKAEYANGYVLRVKYHDCTNFEGVKVMVYRGHYTPRRSLDPHFYEGSDAPVARFRPDNDGWSSACAFARSFA